MGVMGSKLNEPVGAYGQTGVTKVVVFRAERHIE